MIQNSTAAALAIVDPQPQLSLAHTYPGNPAPRRPDPTRVDFVGPTVIHRNPNKTAFLWRQRTLPGHQRSAAEIKTQGPIGLDLNADDRRTFVPADPLSRRPPPHSRSTRQHTCGKQYRHHEHTEHAILPSTYTKADSCTISCAPPCSPRLTD